MSWRSVLEDAYTVKCEGCGVEFVDSGKWPSQKWLRGPDFNGKKHFQQYLRGIFDYDRKVVKLPLLLAMNRMGKDHVTALLDAYLAMVGGGIGARAAAEAAARLADVPRDFKVGLVVVDGLMGGGSEPTRRSDRSHEHIPRDRRN
jgi:hypothetical protein